MTDTNLDRAAQMAGFDDWTDAEIMASLRSRRLIHAHTATLDELDAAKAELEAFKREVSEAVERVLDESGEHIPVAFKPKLARFILPKPVDPLVEAIREASVSDADDGDASRLRAALAKRGLKLERIEHE